VYSQLANYQGIQEGWFGELMLEKFNVKLNIIQESGNTLTTLMEQGDLGDLVVFGAVGMDYTDCIDNGLLLDWYEDDLVEEYGPDIVRDMPAALQYNADISGGKTYGIGHGVATTSEDLQQFMYSWDLRFDYYAELGYPEIKDLDDLISVFEGMKKNHPTDDNGQETYAISLWPDWDGNMVMYVKAFVTAYWGYDELGIGNYNVDTGEFYDCLMINEDGSYGYYLQMLKFFNTLYQKGLLDPDSMTQTYSDATATISSGRTFWSIFNYAGNAVFNTEDNINAGKAMYSVCPEEATPIVYGMSTYGGNRVWTIGAKTKYPDICMAIIDYLSTADGRLESEYGPKGLMWDYDDNNKTYFTEMGKACHDDQTTIIESDDPQYAAYTGKQYKDGMQQINNITWSLDAINPRSGERYNCDYWESNQNPAAEGSIDAKWREWSGADFADEYMGNRKTADGNPAYVVGVQSKYKEGSKTADLKVVWKQVTQTIVDGSWRAIYAKSDAEFDELVQQMIKDANAYDNGNGYNACVEWSKGEAAARFEADNALRALYED